MLGMCLGYTILAYLIDKLLIPYLEAANTRRIQRLKSEKRVKELSSSSA